MCAEGPAGDVTALMSRDWAKPAVRAAPLLGSAGRKRRVALVWTVIGPLPKPSPAGPRVCPRDPRLRPTHPLDMPARLPERPSSLGPIV